MPTSQTSVRATKAPRYFSALCKHFARKVTVDQGPTTARVCFPMGSCDISVDGETMHFCCRAESDPELRRVETIVAEHVTNFGELKATAVRWHDGADE